jgi:hypothetical protein
MSIWTIVLGLFFLAFAAVHFGWEPTPQPAGYPRFWRGRPGYSWLLSRLLPDSATLPIGQLLWVAPMAGYVAAGRGLLGWWVPTSWWQPLAVGSAVGSLLLAALWWHPYQWISALVDAIVLIGVVLAGGWLAIGWIGS